MISIVNFYEDLIKTEFKIGILINQRNEIFNLFWKFGNCSISQQIKNSRIGASRRWAAAARWQVTDDSGGGA